MQVQRPERQVQKQERGRVEAPVPVRTLDRTAPAARIRIQPTRGWPSLRLGELWDYRELLYFLVWRDVKVRYKQTVLGAAWAIIQPFFTMVVFSLFFGKLARLPSEGLPYPLFSYAALVPWQYFANALSQASNSVVGAGGLIQKVYFPRLTLPISGMLAGLVDFSLAFLVLIGMMLYFGHMPTATVIWLPLLLFLAMVTALGVGLWLAALNVRFRDVRHIVPFLMQLWLFATPVAYPSSLLSGPWRTVYAINPMVGVIEGFRWGLLGVHTAPGPMIAVSSFVAVAILIGGLFFFRATERVFADVI